MRATTLAFLVLSGAACSGSGTGGGGDADATGADAHAEVGPDAPVDAPDAAHDGIEPETLEDAGPHDWGEVEFIDPTVPDVPYAAECGNGVVDPGEECDDANRLDGDGCDWLCRIGNGEPPPAPEPGAGDYVPTGDPATLDDFPYAGTTRAVLVWNGEVFATAVCEDMTPLDGGDDAWRIRFRRFNRAGRRLDADWLYTGPRQYTDVELVWNGNGFGLFYDDHGWGIVFMRLDIDGKPLGGPMLIEADADVLTLAADWTGEEFGLAWISRGRGEAHGACSVGAPNPVRMALVRADGTTAGLPGPVVVHTGAGYDVDVAAGDGGFGLFFSGITERDGAWQCGMRFLQVGADLGSAASSGLVVDHGWGWDVKWVDGAYAAAFLDIAGDSHAGGMCVARFTPSGDVEGAPVCTSPSIWGLGAAQELRLAAGDGGLALVFGTAGGSRLLAVRADHHGTPVAEPHDVAEPVSGRNFGHFTTAWAEPGFGVVFQDTANAMTLRIFVPAE